MNQWATNEENKYKEVGSALPVNNMLAFQRISFHTHVSQLEMEVTRVPLHVHTIAEMGSGMILYA